MVGGMKAWMGTFKERSWSHVLGTQNPINSRALVLPTFTYGTGIWGGDLKNSHEKVFKKCLKMHMTSQAKVQSPTTYHVFVPLKLDDAQPTLSLRY